MYTYNGEYDRNQILNIYKEATKYILNVFTNKNHIIHNAIINDQKIHPSHISEIIFDYIKYKYKISSIVFKSAISKFKIDEDIEFD